jgi:hypothetical protein
LLTGRFHRAATEQTKAIAVTICGEHSFGNDEMMSIRLVNLNYTNGKPVCAPMFVAIEHPNYHPTNIEFEEAALKSALGDGLVRHRGEVVAMVEKTSYA